MRGFYATGLTDFYLVVSKGRKEGRNNLLFFPHCYGRKCICELILSHPAHKKHEGNWQHMLEVYSLSFLLKSLSQNPCCCPSNKSLVFLGTENKENEKLNFQREKKPFHTVLTFSSDLSCFIWRDWQKNFRKMRLGPSICNPLEHCQWCILILCCIIIFPTFPTSLFKLVTSCFWLNPTSTHSSKLILYFPKKENQIN